LDEDEAMLLWQDVLDLVASGRTSDLPCPFCKKGQIQVKDNEVTRQSRLECPSCRQFIVGRFRQD
jgi:transposase-like protein